MLTVYDEVLLLREQQEELVAALEQLLNAVEGEGDEDDAVYQARAALSAIRAPLVCSHKGLTDAEAVPSANP